jgi:hypothetical protein
MAYSKVPPDGFWPVSKAIFGAENSFSHSGQIVILVISYRCVYHLLFLYETPSPSRMISLKSAEPQSSPVGRTVPSFRMAAEIERTKWKHFKSLLDKKDKKMFDQMYDCVKLHNAASSNACRPVLIPAVLMSIIFEHYKQPFVL